MITDIQRTRKEELSRSSPWTKVTQQSRHGRMHRCPPRKSLSEENHPYLENKIFAELSSDHGEPRRVHSRGRCSWCSRCWNWSSNSCPQQGADTEQVPIRGPTQKRVQMGILIALSRLQARLVPLQGARLVMG
jgi:hypothetical protein